MQVNASCFFLLTSNSSPCLQADCRSRPAPEAPLARVTQWTPITHAAAVNTLHHVFPPEILPTWRPHATNCCYFLFSLLLGHLSGLLSAQPSQRLCLAGLCPRLFLPHTLLLGDFPHTTFYLKSTSLLWSSRPVFLLLEFSTHRHLTCKYSKSNTSPPTLLFPQFLSQ